MNIKWLETFQRIVELHSFTRAADALDVSQPAVSQQMRNLERHMGTRLLIHTGRGVEITPAGQRVYESAGRIADELRRLGEDLAELVSHADGVVRIACGPTVLCHYMPLLFKEFWARHPGIAIRTYSMVGQAITASVEAGRVDIGIQSPAHLNPAVSAAPCYDEPLALVCAPEHPLARVRTVNPHELGDVRLGLLHRSTETRRMFDEWLTAEGVRIGQVVEFPASEAIRGAALANVVVGLVGAYSVRDDLAAGRLAIVRVPRLDAVLRMYAIHRPALSPAAAQMLAVISDVREVPTFWKG